jgi:cytoskeletal protein RodZ
MTLGESLRHARTSAGFSVDELAERTSIRVGLIREMENNNFKSCGGDTYARGHLRNIAPVLNADLENFLELYDLEHAADQRRISDMLSENSVTKIPTEKKTVTWKSLAIASAISLAAIAGAQIIISNSTTTTTPVAVPSASVTPTVKPQEPTQAIAPANSDGVVLTISATRGNANIDVVIDGISIFKGRLFQGDSKDFQSSTSISIYLSNAGDLDLTLNGDPLEPLGTRNQEVRKTFRSK